MPSSFPHYGASPMQKFLAACRRLDDHWIGDLIGVVCLFALGYAALLLGYVLEGGM